MGGKAAPSTRAAEEKKGMRFFSGASAEKSGPAPKPTGKKAKKQAVAAPQVKPYQALFVESASRIDNDSYILTTDRFVLYFDIFDRS